MATRQMNDFRTGACTGVNLRYIPAITCRDIGILMRESSVSGHLSEQCVSLEECLQEIFSESPSALKPGAPDWLYESAVLAFEMVQTGDVIGFAAPSHLSSLEVQKMARTLSDTTNDIIPSVLFTPSPFIAMWLPAWSNPSFRAIRRRLVSLFLESTTKTFDISSVEETATVVDSLVTDWISIWMDQLCNEVLEMNEAVAKPSYRVLYRGEEEILKAWFHALKKSRKQEFAADGWLIGRALRQELTATGWVSPDLTDWTGKTFYQLGFSLCAPEVATNPWTLKYELVHRYFGTRIPLGAWWNSEIRCLRTGSDILVGADVWILERLLVASRMDTAIAESLHHPVPVSAELAAKGLMEWMEESLPKLHAAGFSVQTPAWSDAPADVKIRVQVKSSKSRRESSMPRSSISSGRLASIPLVEFDWTVVIDNQELTQEQFMDMVAEKQNLVEINGSWKLVSLGDILRKMESIGLGLSTESHSISALRLSRSLLLQEATDDLSVDFSYTEDAREAEQLIRSMISAGSPPEVNTPQGFVGELRPYQKLGFSWMVHLRNLHCGACLADDMGLGKTVQVIAYLQYIHEQRLNEAPHLLVCPTSLIQNWRSELARFAPELRVHLHHGPNRNDVQESGWSVLEEALSKVDIILTTYAILVRDEEQLTNLNFDVVVVDEAQNIKNIQTKQSKAAMRLTAKHRIALTGTPVENRLEELWSILSFVNPGYLGTQSWFRNQFELPIGEDASHPAGHRLRALLKPVLLRRRKSEPSIRMELPEKWETRSYASLTVEQAALYQSVVDRLFGHLENSTDMSRRGQILASLVRLKQICDYPGLVAGGKLDISRSGKLKLLLELLDEVDSNLDAALIFTQFREMGHLLTEAIELRFGQKPLFLHGGLSARMRGEMVHAYQHGAGVSPFFVLSLRAGGVGLNLTRANHVFHFDRWWNPAVEDQATDRAFRMGQTRDVQVHKLICAGTLEERIDELLSAKRELSQSVVGTSEAWVTELDNHMLRELFQLDASVEIEEDA